ncbi:twin-arginine translocase subunit TatC [Lottiidibacillus patelloidae]|uniref:Sec-independent protein translocase protein TatC n=1 Tax=Lottiidibacillus patelloidae TaxID=2670334 RepID=A0A263BQG2_9BACI|nr:twin-arginine translocase subunit TatC [Lottiidibacillus patelloidae]OZM55808.1 twin-arginine translocase subunit TatC [Lottiidibacillus patelloidae]
MEERQMSVYDHIDELRKKIIVVVGFFIVSLIGGLFLAKPLIKLMQVEVAKEITLNAFRLTDPIKIYMEIAFILAVVVTVPLALYQLWSFVSPGLYERERKVTLMYIPVSVILFLVGISFSYFIVFPFIIEFMGRLATDLGIAEVYGINEYFSFLLQIVLPFGFLFQLPVIIMFFTRLGIVTPMFLSSVRRYAYFVLLVVGGLITPPEVLSHIMVTIPLILLYEVSIVISKIAYRKSQAEAEKHHD